MEKMYVIPNVLFLPLVQIMVCNHLAEYPLKQK